MEFEIVEIEEILRATAVEIFAGAFVNDPLFIFAFADKEQRLKLTRIMYEFVVYDMAPELNLAFKGVFSNTELAGCMIFSTPESAGWNDTMNDSLDRMRAKAADENINLIGEFAMLRGFRPDGEHFYGNELAVKEKFRGMGLGTALLKYLIDSSESHPGSRGILIDTANRHNIKLYEKHGWELRDKVPFYNMNKYFLWRKNRK